MLSIHKDSPNFLIDSKDRTSGTNSNFHINVKLKKDNSYNMISLVHAGVPKSYYNIDSQNNTFTLTENGSSTTVTLTPGDYTSSTFPAHLEYQLDAASLVIDASNPWTYSATFDSTTHKLTITSTEHASRTMTTNSITFSGFNNPFLCCGFHQDSINSFTVNTGTGTLVSDYPCCFERTKYITIKSNIAHNEGNDHHDSAILARIPVPQTSFNSVITYDVPELIDSSRRLANNRSNSYSFALCDDFDRELNLNHRSWFLTLFVYEYNEVPKKQNEEIEYIRKEREKEKIKKELEKEQQLEQAIKLERSDPTIDTPIYLPVVSGSQSM